jgi:SAM-dependent methyltransferase
MPRDEVFDEYAEDYESMLDQGLSVSGEDMHYFARRRITWLAECLRQHQIHPRSVLDYGCGTGAATPFFFEQLGVDTVLGTDVSSSSLEVARQTHGLARTQFLSLDTYEPSEQIDLVFCNGVFHHIPPQERAAAVEYIFKTLRPGGLLAFWENNPWNPGTRYVMSRLPCDRDAITLTPPEARRLLHSGGFKVLRTHFLFIFPRFLSWFRRLEPLAARLPLGAQYQVLCRKPECGEG